MTTQNKINKNELGIYLIMMLIIIFICIVPKNDFFKNLTKNTNSLMIGFICISLFMILDNRLAVLFLVVLIISYYENIKEEGFYYQMDPADPADAEDQEAAAAADPADNTEISLFGLTLAQSKKNLAARDIETKVSSAINRFKNARVKINTDFVDNINNSTNLCSNVSEAKNKLSEVDTNSKFKNTSTIQENFIRDRVPEIIRENFNREKFNNIDTNAIDKNPIRERATNFKDDDFVKTLNGLATQNEINKSPIVGHNIEPNIKSNIESNIESNNGSPLDNTDYNNLKREYIGTPFYPLNA